jgi:NADH dehydrogenase
MSQKLVILSTEFTGICAALSAARLRDASRPSIKDEIALVYPEPTLMVPPRLYETNPENDREPVTDL